MTTSEIIALGGYLTTLFGLIIVFYTNTNVRLKALEIEVSQLKQNNDSHEKKLDVIGGKLDGIKDMISEVKIQLENKENRK